ncbi:MAG TPA: FG-GAP-like repeat-containing protein [Myxococcaceae bacterium]|nr:FG-GAP-like repeat-containing protein [Myxococcaceae bacterium]
MGTGCCAPRGALLVPAIGLTLWVAGALVPPEAAAQCPTFGPPTPFGAAAGTLAPADYDVDGNPDLAVGGVVLYGDGAGGFGAPVSVLNISALAAVDLGGVDPPVPGINNAAPELVGVSTVNGNAAVGLGSGSRGFPFQLLAGFPVEAAPPRAAVAADLNGDGIPELVIAYGNPVNALFVWIGTNTSTNWVSEIPPLEISFDDPVALAAGDFDDDGRMELLALSRRSNLVAELKFTGRRTFVSQNVAISGGPTAMAVADLDGDGLLDVVITTGNGELVSALGTGAIVTGANGAPAAFGSLERVSLGGNPLGVVLGDVDGDRRTDAVVVDRGTQRVIPLIGDGKGGFTPGTGLPTGSPAPTSVMLADLDHDGALDIVSGDASDAHVFVRHNGCAGAALDLEVTGMEVTQGIQDLGNSVVLVADRPTFVRVHVKAGAPVDGVTARLARTDGNGTELERPLWPSNPGGSITVRAAPDRSELSQSFLFELPPAWTAQGVLHLTATVNPDHLPGETSFANNVASRDVTFQTTNPIKIELVKVKFFTRAGPDTGCGQDSVPSDADLDLAESALRRELPTAKLVITRAADVWDSGLQLDCTLNIALGVDSGMVLDAFRTAFASAPQDRIRLGLVKRDAFGGLAPAGSSWFAVAEAGIDQVAVHEIGHTLGRFHTVSPNGPPCSPALTPTRLDASYPYPSGLIGGPSAQPDRFVGFDLGDATAARWPILRRVVPPTTGDLMGYCQQTWSSDYTWTGNRNGINAHFTPTDPSGDFLRVTARLDPSGGKLSGLGAVRLGSVGALAPPSPGKWHLQLLDGKDVVLSDHRFSPTPDADGPASGIEETLDFMAGTRSIVVLDPGGRRLGSLPVSAHAPGVGKLTLSTGKVVPASGPVGVLWSPSDADGDPLLADLLWSRDGGSTFEPIASGIVGSTYTFDASRLSGTGGKASGMLRVVVRDPVLTAVTDLGGIVAAGSPPRIRILAPFAGQTYVRGQTAVLRAIASDVEDGVLDGAVSWGSDRDGPLGGGANVAARLSLGNHLLTARVVDSSGNVATATTTVQVSSVLPPGAAPTAVAGKTQSTGVGATVVLDGRGSSDPDGDALTYSWRVTQLPAGLLGLTLSGGGPIATFVAPKGGTYGFELTVTDLRQGTSTDAVQVHVPNVVPSVNVVAPTSGTVFFAGPVTVQATFTDRGLDTHGCTVVWDEDTRTPPVPGTLSEADQTCTATRTLSAGVYSVRVSVRDDEGGEGVARVQIIVADPRAGRVSGDGRIVSPRGALASSPRTAGKAAFDFRSAYSPGATRPTGELEFHLARFSFRAEAQDWLVVSGSRAQVRGTGRVNGRSGYAFLLTAADLDPSKECDEDRREEDRDRRPHRHHDALDRFRLKVWSRASGAVVYDNVRGAPEDVDSASPQRISSGCITVTHPGNHPYRKEHDR